MDILIDSFQAVLSPSILIWIVLGVGIGYVVGVLPGLGKGTAVAVAIPLTFYLPPIEAISFLIGIAKGSTAGGAVLAILLNTPGEPSSAPTALDGYPLARQGKGKKALKMALFASVIGDFVSTVLLIVLAAPLARYALLIGPVEMCAILLFALTFIGALSGTSFVKGLIAGVFGLLLSTIGLETETAVPRFTFDLLALFDGLPLIPVAIGMLATAEMILQIGNRHALDDHIAAQTQASKPEDDVVTRADWRACAPAIFRGTAIGAAIGMLPGLGASVASFLSYGAAKKASKTPERFGHGALEGVAAAESADNAVVPASFVPLFALGIPGTVIAAIMISAFIIQGLTPGPRMFIDQPVLVYGIYAAMLCASVIMLAIGYFGLRFFSLVAKVRVRNVAPAALFFCTLGSFLQGGGLFGVIVMLVFGVIGVFAKKLEYSFVTFLIGFVLGPAFELSLRQSIALLNRDVMQIIHHPIALIFIASTVITIVRMCIHQVPKTDNPSQQNTP